MNILVTNDDSIHAPGIALLAQAAAALGDVWVVAPAHQCSAMSQRLTIRGHLQANRLDAFPAPVKVAYAVDGTPADCVKAALALLPDPPDYIFSGINNGYNAGFDIAYSGTLGAAFEAVMNGIPAIAFSNAFQAPLTIPRLHLRAIAEALLQSHWDGKSVWNVNFPDREPGSLRGILENRTIAPMGMYYSDYLRKEIPSGSILLKTVGKPLDPQTHVPEGTDVKALLDGYISVGKVRCAVL